MGKNLSKNYSHKGTEARRKARNYQIVPNTLCLCASVRNYLSSIFPIFYGVIIFCFIIMGCVRQKEAIPRIVLAEDITLPVVTGLAWLSAEDSPGGDRFVSVTEDGLARVWEVFTGRQLYISKDLSQRH